MSNRLIMVNDIIEAICEVVKINQKNKISLQQLAHASSIFQEAVKNQEDYVSMFDDFLENTKKLKPNERVKVIRCILLLYKELNQFDNECLRILNMKG